MNTILLLEQIVFVTHTKSNRQFKNKFVAKYSIKPRNSLLLIILMKK